jgi:uncharacterized protein YabN with tetrapyrrole methylase and pyrophosphatase domain
MRLDTPEQQATGHRGSLTVVGTGIRFGLQTTPEARRRMERAEKVLYLLAEPASAAWLRTLNPSAESLHRFYAPDKDRRTTYHEIVEEILTWLRRGSAVCAVFYGHPGVYVDPAQEVIKRAREEGFDARMLPGISAEDCLFADLGLDPGQSGCQSFDATDFLLYPRNFDTSTPLVLWQVGAVGEVRPRMARPAGLRVLADRLATRYGPDHPVVLYEASPYPICDPIVQKVLLADLDEADLTPMATLYIPPLGRPEPDIGMLGLLGMPDPVGVSSGAGTPVTGDVQDVPPPEWAGRHESPA